jgi:hypothetical protein
MPPGQTSANQLDAADFDNPVAVGDGHTGGLGIEDNPSFSDDVLYSHCLPPQLQARILA